MLQSSYLQYYGLLYIYTYVTKFLFTVLWIIYIHMLQSSYLQYYGYISVNLPWLSYPRHQT